ncbi:hypothetical protein QBC44DRAFT_405657 [Cladorrhinum sp. PSN332]|nr:hypothetical protein QBC44DRAFT_405657 [Cladorrhinum sp. PSN332]
MAAPGPAAAVLANVIPNSGMTYRNYLSMANGTQIDEAISNSIWAEVLRAHFPFPAFLVVPEYQAATAGRADLLVHRYSAPPNGAAPINGMYLGRPNRIFALEGKGYLTPQALCSKTITDQVFGYIKTMKPSGLGGQARKFGILVSCDKFMVLSTESDGTHPSYVTWNAANLRLQYDEVGTGSLHYGKVRFLLTSVGDLDLILAEIATFY